MATKTPTLRAQAAEVAANTDSAYSFDRYRSWESVAFALLKAGYTKLEAQGIMRSKFARWAADAVGRYDNIPAKALVEFCEQEKARNAGAFKADLADFVKVEEALANGETA